MKRRYCCYMTLSWVDKLKKMNILCGPGRYWQFLFWPCCDTSLRNIVLAMLCNIPEKYSFGHVVQHPWEISFGHAVQHPWKIKFWSCWPTSLRNTVLARLSHIPEKYSHAVLWRHKHSIKILILLIVLKIEILIWVWLALSEKTL